MNDESGNDFSSRSEKMTPRAPSKLEEKELMKAFSDEYGTDSDYNDMWGAYIAIFDNYITGGPGWFGKLAVVVYDGSPDFVQSWRWIQAEQRWTLCGDYKDI